MADALLNTKAGQAMLADAMKREGGRAFTDRSFYSYLHDDPWPLYVRYEGENAVFVPRDRFYFRDPSGPSACLWIVPGTAQS